MLLAADPAAAEVVDPAAWLHAYKSTEQVVARLPVALNHGELAIQQLGRTTSGCVVLFDLETMAVLPCFTDIAAVLANLADMAGRPQGDLFARYLSELTSLTGATSPEESAWTELLAVRVVLSFQALPWLMEMAGDPVVEFDPGSFARNLGTDLHELESRS